MKVNNKFLNIESKSKKSQIEKEIHEFEDEKSKKIMQLGLSAYDKIRRGNIDESLFGGLIYEIKKIDLEIYNRMLDIADMEGHNELAQLLIDKEVIFAEDVERIFGKRPWASRSEEIMAAKESQDAARAERELAEKLKAEEQEIKEEEAKNSAQEEATTETKITAEGKKVTVEGKVTIEAKSNEKEQTTESK